MTGTGVLTSGSPVVAAAKEPNLMGILGEAAVESESMVIRGLVAVVVGVDDAVALVLVALPLAVGNLTTGVSGFDELLTAEAKDVF